MIRKYRQQGYPEHNGLVEDNFLMRRHNEPEMIRFAEEWWKNVLEFSRRDQLSFNYVAWKLGTDFEIINDKVLWIMEWLSDGRNRGHFFNSTFNFYPTRTR
jgi:hypothetical protein